MEFAEEMEVFSLIPDCCLESLTEESATPAASLDLILSRGWTQNLA